ncbi:MAG TPA: sulfotransferase family protein [Gammaproteobacteria bacterium]|nr:sulfotransferase family protein [Gammaproteobacteria bacterium]
MVTKSKDPGARAQALYEERKLPEALKMFEKICAADPDNASAWVMRGACHQKLGDFDAAVASLQQAVSLEPESVEIQLNLANALVTSGDLPQAVEIYQEILRLRPERAAVWALLGKVWLQLNNPRAAEQVCRRALQLKPGNINALMTLGNALRAAGDRRQALDCFQKVAGLMPQHGAAHAQSGRMLHQLGECGAAIEAYRKAVQCDPGRQAIHYRLGRLLQDEGQIEAAEAAYRQAVKLRPDDVPALTNLAHVLMLQKKQKDALFFYRRALEQDPESIQLHVNLGCALRDLERYQEAVDAFRKSIQIASGSGEAGDSADAYYYMGLTLQAQGRLEEAADSLREAVRLYPEYVPYLLGLARLQQAMEDYSRALGSFQRVLQVEPGNGDAYFGKGGVLHALGRNQEAISDYRQAVRYRPNIVRYKIALAAALMGESRHEEAAEYCEAALSARPDDADAIALAAQIAVRRGETAKAYEYLRPLLEKEDLSENVIMAFANVSRDVGRIPEAIRLLQGAVDKGALQSTESRVNLHFNLGRLYDMEGDYDSAFHHFAQGNRLKQVSFGAAHHMLEVDALITQNSWFFINGLPRSTIRSERPVFIVGMPRSGTTLVEQILSSHPAVHGAGELPDIGQMAERLPAMLGTRKRFPQCLSLVTASHLDELAGTYLARLAKLSPDARRVTDKMLGFMYLGLIQLVFPSARVIHCKRDPLDTCLSGYFQDFSSAHPYSYDLYNLGVYYRGYEKIMQNWRNVLSIPMLEVQYEEMVVDQENVSRRLIEFCGLEWDDRCLKFHENERFVGTASYDQVRRPIYTSSVRRWENYEKYIGPLREALELFQVQQHREGQ